METKGAESEKSKVDFPLSQLQPALPNSLQTLQNGCLCGDKDKLSVDFISKPCLLELTQEEGSPRSGLTLRSADSKPLPLLSDSSPQTEGTGTDIDNIDKIQSNLGFEPQS
jgi:hypothetical protein